jgi:molybdopterin converting factor small subunit
MIRVRCMGHIGTSIGRKEVVLDDIALSAPELVEKLRTMSKEKNPGFNRYNTLALVGDGEAFVPASSTREIKSGEDVVLIPFSHGG